MDKFLHKFVRSFSNTVGIPIHLGEKIVRMAVRLNVGEIFRENRRLQNEIHMMKNPDELIVNTLMPAIRDRTPSFDDFDWSDTDVDIWLLTFTMYYSNNERTQCRLHFTRKFYDKSDEPLFLPEPALVCSIIMQASSGEKDIWYADEFIFPSKTYPVGPYVPETYERSPEAVAELRNDMFESIESALQDNYGQPKFLEKVKVDDDEVDIDD